MAKEKATKITEAELQEIQKYVGALQQVQMQLGAQELAKQELLDNVRALRTNLAQVQGNLEKTYGDVSINMQDGTITPNDASNS